MSVTATTAFNTLLGDLIQGKNGQVEVSSLKGKYLGLYFSGHWCGPCRGFTPELAKFYTANAARLNLEIVFVSSDRDADGFNEYYGEMPWLALPYADRDKKAQLGKMFKVQGIPTFVLLGPDGSLITTKGREGVNSDPEGENFPWKPKTLVEALGNSFLSKAGPVDKTAFKDKVVGVYFSAHWCGPCRGFTPNLIQTYKTLKEAGKPFEIIFVSSDQDQEAFDEYYGEMPWLAVPFEDRERQADLSNLWDVGGIPTLVLLNSDLTLLTTNGRAKIAADPTGAEFPWLPKPVEPIQEVAGSLNEETAVLLLVDMEAAEKKQAALDAFTAAAGSKPAGLSCWAAAKETDGITKQIRRLTSAAETGTVLVILDIPDNGGYYMFEGAEITKEKVSEFVSKYAAHTLERKQLSRSQEPAFTLLQ